MADAAPRPRGDRVVVKLLDDSERPSGIVIPQGVTPYPSRGVVLYTGPGWRVNSGDYVPLDLRVGDEVLFFKSDGVEMILGDEAVLLLRDQHVLMVTEPALVTVESESL